jgi:beta-glucosidase/6-phospho-beta-glucosidase/beta-galactosidase
LFQTFRRILQVWAIVKNVSVLQDVGGPSGWACTYNVIAAHAAAVQKFREITSGKIGMALDIEWVVPSSDTKDDQVHAHHMPAYCKISRHDQS